MYHTTGFSRDEISDLCEIVWQAAAETGKADWPPRLGLYQSVVVTLCYLRRNRAQAEIAECFGVSQPTISRAISAISPLLEKVLAGFVPTADEIDPNSQLIVTAVPRSFFALGSRFAGRCCDVIMTGVASGGR